DYFPGALRRYDEAIKKHPLRREIVATLLSNDIVDRAGPTFVLRAQQETGHDAADVARAFAIVRELFSLDALWTEVESLDNQLPASAQYAMLFQAGRMLRQAAYWLLQHQTAELDVGDRVAALKPSVVKLLGRLGTLLKGAPKRRLRGVIAEYERLGVPAGLAGRIAGLSAAITILDVVDLAGETSRSPDFVARVYLGIGRGLNLAWLRAEIENLEVRGRWQAAARRHLRTELQEVHRSITADRLRRSRADTPDELVMKWLSEHGAQIQRAKGMLLDIQSRESADFATLTVAVRELRQLIG
ncbi:MAG: NAD-glutamate dehydrogenase, partial [Pseudomonadales bacterium]|nr:NAD-glutamate dehydrogenase [Pseudomonadales bacterium]